MGEKGIEAPGGAADAGGSSVHMVARPLAGPIVGALGELAVPGAAAGPDLTSSAVTPGIPGVPSGGGGGVASGPTSSSSSVIGRPPTG
jgi:hypothetical protein